MSPNWQLGLSLPEVSFDSILRSLHPIYVDLCSMVYCIIYIITIDIILSHIFIYTYYN